MEETGLTIRKLTEIECLRLQGFTEEEARMLHDAEKNGKKVFPKTLLYRFAGNAVCVNCFERITEQILNDIEHPRTKTTLDRWVNEDESGDLYQSINDQTG